MIPFFDEVMVGVAIALVTPHLSWVIAVERRLSRLREMAERMQRVERQVDKLVDHLISKHNA